MAGKNRTTVADNETASLGPGSLGFNPEAAAAAALLGNATDISDSEVEVDEPEFLEGEEYLDDFPEDWKPPYELEAPKPRPGMAQRWCRINIRGEADAQNRAANEQEGWRPRRIETVPEDERSRFPVIRDSKYGNIIQHADVILKEMPLALKAKRDAYYNAKRDRQMGAVVEATLAKDNESAGHGIGAIRSDLKITPPRRRAVAQANG